VRWNEQKQRWMAWVRFADGSRRQVERVEKADAQADLDELVTVRAQLSAPDAARNQQATFAEVIEAWFAAGCPNVSPSRTSRHAREKSPNTIANAHQLLGTLRRSLDNHAAALQQGVVGSSPISSTRDQRRRRTPLSSSCGLRSRDVRCFS
jgi:hypothetical protein